MDKKLKQRRQKYPTPDELTDVGRSGGDPTPPGASFDTEEGRAAQGMRPDLGGKSDEAGEIPSPPDLDDDRDETTER